jgi:hypothetical protein
LEPAPVGLPPGWIEHLDRASGNPYFHHAATNTTTWDRPYAGALAPSVTDLPSAAAPHDSGAKASVAEPLPVADAALRKSGAESSVAEPLSAADAALHASDFESPVAEHIVELGRGKQQSKAAVRKVDGNNSSRGVTFVFLAGIEGSGHHLWQKIFQQIQRESSAGLARPDLTTAAKNAVLPPKKGGVSDETYQRRLESLMQKIVKDSSGPATYVLNTAGPGSMLSYPDMSTVSYRWPYPRLGPLRGTATAVSNARVVVLFLARSPSACVLSRTECRTCKNAVKHFRLQFTPCDNIERMLARMRPALEALVKDLESLRGSHVEVAAASMDSLKYTPTVRRLATFLGFDEQVFDKSVGHFVDVAGPTPNQIKPPTSTAKRALHDADWQAKLQAYLNSTGLAKRTINTHDRACSGLGVRLQEMATIGDDAFTPLAPRATAMDDA